MICRCKNEQKKSNPTSATPQKKTNRNYLKQLFATFKKHTIANCFGFCIIFLLNFLQTFYCFIEFCHFMEFWIFFGFLIIMFWTQPSEENVTQFLGLIPMNEIIRKIRLWIYPKINRYVLRSFFMVLRSLFPPTVFFWSSDRCYFLVFRKFFPAPPIVISWFSNSFSLALQSL